MPCAARELAKRLLLLGREFRVEDGALGELGHPDQLGSELRAVSGVEHFGGFQHDGVGIRERLFCRRAESRVGHVHRPKQPRRRNAVLSHLPEKASAVRRRRESASAFSHTSGRSRTRSGMSERPAQTPPPQRGLERSRGEGREEPYGLFSCPPQLCPRVRLAVDVELARHRLGVIFAWSKGWRG